MDLEITYTKFFPKGEATFDYAIKAEVTILGKSYAVWEFDPTPAQEETFQKRAEKILQKQEKTLLEEETKND